MLPNWKQKIGGANGRFRTVWGGTGRFTRMPFGLCNTSRTFQRLIDTVLADIHHTTAYVDEIIVGSHPRETHRNHLHETLERLSLHNLRFKHNKCVFFQQTVTFLGHTISPEGIRPLESRIAAIKSFP